MRRTSRTIVIAGGGTAGHVAPGLSIAGALVAAGVDGSDIHYIGSERGIERTLVPAAGYRLTVLPGRGIKRRLALSNVGAIAGLLRAIVKSLGIIRNERPRAVLCLGGYASVPAALGALAWRVPLVVAEQNAVPGAANRLVARFAKASAVSFPGTALPRATVTGNPVRAEILAVDRSDGARRAARARLGVPDGRRVVLAFGGSLGARRINEGILAMASLWRNRTDVSIRHVIGERDWSAHEAQTAELSRGEALHYVPVRYESDMAACYAAADVVVCRAGATTVAELAIVGVPAVLVPLPGAPGDHQTANARALTEAGAARLMADRDISGPSLATALDAVFDDRALAARAAARPLARPAAAIDAAALVLRYAKLPS